MLKDFKMGLGLDTYSDQFAGGELINTVFENVVIDSFGREKKREGLSYHNVSESFNDTRTSELFFWVEGNLMNNRAWVFYDKTTGQIKIKEG